MTFEPEVVDEGVAVGIHTVIGRLRGNNVENPDAVRNATFGAQ